MHSSGGARDSADPIAELLSQLSGVRRAQSNSVPGSSASSLQGSQNVSSQLQQLQMQLQLERQQVRVLNSSNNIYVLLKQQSCILILLNKLFYFYI